MLSKLKKILLKPKELILEDTYNTDLVEALGELIYGNDLREYINDPVYKLYVLRVYTNNLNHLFSNLTNTNFNANISAVNFNSYFQDKDSDLRMSITRILPILTKQQIPNRISHDLFEIVSAFRFFRGTLDGQE